jgi:hypothetical protein
MPEGKVEGVEEQAGDADEGFVEDFNWSGHLPFTNNSFSHCSLYLPQTELQNCSPSICSLHLMFFSVMNQEQSTISELFESEKVPRTSSGQGLTANNFSYIIFIMPA